MINKATTQRFVQLTPFQQAVTYYARKYTDGVALDEFKSYPLPRARGREITKKDVVLNPELILSVDKVFELWSPVMEAVSMPNPRKDDYLTDAAGNSWTVAHVLGEFDSNVWTLLVRRRVS